MDKLRSWFASDLSRLDQSIIYLLASSAEGNVTVEIYNHFVKCLTAVVDILKIKPREDLFRKK